MPNPMYRRAIADACTIAVVIFLAFAGVAATQSDHLTELMHRWQTRDGGAVSDVSFALSQEFVRRPRAFLVAMSSQREIWRTWLEGLPNDTFTVYVEGRRPA